MKLPEMATKRPWRCLVVVLLVFGTICIYRSAAVASQRAAMRCDIQHGPCVTITDNGTTITFDIMPKPVTVMADLAFIVILSRNGKPVDNASVHLDLSMPGMVMGKNQPVLKQTNAGRYEGNGVIIRCMSGRKTWQARVSAKNSGESSAADFIFEVH